MKNKDLWNSYVEKNDNPYGRTCIKVAARVMELLDADPTPLHNGCHPDIHTAHGLIRKADHDTDGDGLTGFQVGVVAKMVSLCHERGDEFRKSHNGEEYQGEGVVNPASLIMRKKC